MKPRLITITQSSTQILGRRSCKAHKEERASYTHSWSTWKMQRQEKGSLTSAVGRRRGRKTGCRQTHTTKRCTNSTTHPLLRDCSRNTLSCKQRDKNDKQNGCSGMQWNAIFQLYALHRGKKNNFIIGHRQRKAKTSLMFQ